jgi:uncharacterized membrane protein (UPF0127 family)
MSRLHTFLAYVFRHIRKGLLIGTLSGLTLSAMLMTGAHSAEPADLLRGFTRTQLIIDSSSRGCILFDIYIANSWKQRSQGLMFIRSMNEYEGMLFIYPEPAEISMWMKNTLIPLDMLFIDQRLTITSIHKNATPLSTDIISSGGVVNGVIELNGGSAEKFGIRQSDQIIFPVS